jgi:hypothetical protein
LFNFVQEWYVDKLFISEVFKRQSRLKVLRCFRKPFVDRHKTLTVIINESLPSELVHEITYAGARRPNHAGEVGLADPRQNRL